MNELTMSLFSSRATRRGAVLVFFLIGMLFSPFQSRADTATVITDTSWRVIAPDGNQEGRQIFEVGLAWEAANPGWNTNPAFNDSSGDWHNAIFTEGYDNAYANAPLIWADGPLGSGSTPAYFRKTFTLSKKPTSALLRLAVDDDAQVYINGELVINDQQLGSSGFTIDVSASLKRGINLIAIKAQDSVGGYEWLTARLEVSPCHITDLGTLGGDTSAAAAINEHGQIVGVSQLSPSGAEHAFLWEKGKGMIDLGSLPDWPNSSATDINDVGQVIGNAFVGYDSHAFLWQKGKMIDLGTLTAVGYESASARSINNRGDVLGASGIVTKTGSYYSHPFLWRKGNLIDLGTLGDALSSTQAFSMNNRSQVVGGSVTSNGAGHAYLWDKGAMNDLGTLDLTDPLNASRAYDINDSSGVVGFSTIYVSAIGNQARHAFLWKNGTMNDLGTLDGTRASEARRINSSGQVVGFMTYNDGARHAFLWKKGAMNDLGTLGGRESFTADINSAGKVIGSSNIASGDTHGFLWDQKNRMTDLGTLGGTLSNAIDINNAGQVVGSASTTEEKMHAVLWECN